MRRRTRENQGKRKSEPVQNNDLVVIVEEGTLEKKSTFLQWQARFFQLCVVKLPGESIYLLDYYRSRDSAERDKNKDNYTKENRVRIDLLDVKYVKTGKADSRAIELGVDKTTFNLRAKSPNDASNWVNKIKEAQALAVGEKNGSKIPKVETHKKAHDNEPELSKPALTILAFIEVIVALATPLLACGLILATSDMWKRQGMPSLFDALTDRLTGGHAARGCEDLTANVALFGIAMLFVGAVLSYASETFSAKRKGISKVGTKNQKPVISGAALGTSIAFSLFFMMQGLHDVSIDFYVLHGMKSIDLPTAIERIHFWRQFYSWRHEEFIFKGIERLVNDRIHGENGLGVYVPLAYLLVSIPALKWCGKETMKLIGCFNRRAPLAYHYADLAYFVLLFLVFPPLLIYNVLPLEASARSCTLPSVGESVATDAHVFYSDSTHHEAESIECVHLAVDLCLMHTLKFVIQASLFTATLIKFSASQRQRSDRRVILHNHGGEKYSTGTRNLL